MTKLDTVGILVKKLARVQPASTSMQGRRTVEAGVAEVARFGRSYRRICRIEDRQLYAQ